MTDALIKNYEIRLFNKVVRTLLETGEPNTTGWSDNWADASYETVIASKPEEAIAKVRQRFPKHQGFVITHVLEIGDEQVKDVSDVVIVKDDK